MTRPITTPPTGEPLTAETAGLLKKGDLLMCRLDPAINGSWSRQAQPAKGDVCIFVAAIEARVTVEGFEAFPGQMFKFLPDRFTFVSRPTPQVSATLGEGGDYDRLFDEVSARYPKILARLSDQPAGEGE